MIDGTTFRISNTFVYSFQVQVDDLVLPSDKPGTWTYVHQMHQSGDAIHAIGIGFGANNTPYWKLFRDDSVSGTNLDIAPYESGEKITFRIEFKPHVSDGTLKVDFDDGSGMTNVVDLTGQTAKSGSNPLPKFGLYCSAAQINTEGKNTVTATTVNAALNKLLQPTSGATIYLDQITIDVRD